MNEMLELRVHPTYPRARVRVLRGEDGGHTYEVRVPLRLRTVEAALDWLRPADVPADAARQGEFFFVPAENAHKQFCSRFPRCDRLDDHGADWQERASQYAFHVYGDGVGFSTSHYADECVRVVKSGSVAFLGRRRVRCHNFTGRPRFFVRGVVRHARGDHADLALPPGWHEVMPNRAHGPFPVRGMAKDD